MPATKFGSACSASCPATHPAGRPASDAVDREANVGTALDGLHHRASNHVADSTDRYGLEKVKGFGVQETEVEELRMETGVGKK